MAYFHTSGNGTASASINKGIDPFGQKPVAFLKEMPSNNDFNGLLKLR